MIKINSRVGCWTRRLATVGLLSINSSTLGDTIVYLRLEDESGSSAADQTGTFNGDLISFDSTDAGMGDSTGIGWSTNVSVESIPQSGEPNAGSIRLGPTAYIDLSNGQDMDLGYEFTIEMFMNPDMPVIGSSVYGLSGYSGTSMALTESLGVLYWNMHFNSETPYSLATGIQIGEWQHVALVKVPGLYSIYINGVLEASGPVGSDGDGPYYFPGTDNTGDRVIGGNSGTFSGWLDEFRISDTALTPDQFLCAYGIPEPGTLSLMLLGAAGLVWRRKRK